MKGVPYHGIACLCRAHREETLEYVSAWAERTYGPRNQTGSPWWHETFGVFCVRCECAQKARALFECDCRLYLTPDGRYARRTPSGVDFYLHYRRMHKRPRLDRYGSLKQHECNRANHTYFRHYHRLYIAYIENEVRLHRWQTVQRADLRTAQEALRQVRRLLSKPKLQEA